MTEYHQPVLLKESVDALITDAEGTYVDVTFGGGGHSREILKRLGKKGKIIAFDQDADAFKNTIDDKRFMLAGEVDNGWALGAFGLTCVPASPCD